jgi:hypothetical protein
VRRRQPIERFQSTSPIRREDLDTTLDTYGHLMAGAFQGIGERLDGPT